MKKLTILTAITCICLGATACGGQADNSSEDIKEPVEQAEKATENETKADDAQEDSPEVAQLDFTKLPENFTFASGAGGWSTDIQIADDGSFEGTYHDSDMGSDGEGYPGGTMYYCQFNGKFAPLEATDKENVFKTSLEELNVTTPTGTEEIVDEVLYVYGDPYGFEDAKDFYIYAPGADITELDEFALSWLSIDPELFPTMPDGMYGILNESPEYMFYSNDEDSIWNSIFSNREDDYSNYYVEFSPSHYYGGSSLLFWTPRGVDEKRLMVAVPWNGKTAPATYECKEMYEENDNKYEVSIEKITDDEITISMKSKPAFDLTKWGGDADGNISITLQKMTHEEYYE